MPIWLRNLTFNKLSKWYEEKNEKKDPNIIDPTNSEDKKKMPKVKVPDYITKKAKK